MVRKSRTVFYTHRDSLTCSCDNELFAPANVVNGFTFTWVIMPVCVVLRISWGVPGAGISKVLVELSLDGKTVPSCADTRPRIATHVDKASSTILKAAMMEQFKRRWFDDELLRWRLCSIHQECSSW